METLQDAEYTFYEQELGLENSGLTLQDLMARYYAQFIPVEE